MDSDTEARVYAALQADRRAVDEALHSGQGERALAFIGAATAAGVPESDLDAVLEDLIGRDEQVAATPSAILAQIRAAHARVTR